MSTHTLNVELSNELYQIPQVLVRYCPKIKASDRPKVVRSIECYEVFLQEWNSDTICYIEEFKILLLNRASRVLGIATISVGGMAGTVADPKIIFGKALAGGAHSIVLAHNHPSESVHPSNADLHLTQKLCACGAMLDISVLDHLIIAPTDYFSFADQGLL